MSNRLEEEMPLDSYRTLGNSGLRVSAFMLGTMTFGEDWGWGSSPELSEAILDRFTDRGGNALDTANLYTNGHSEQIIGDYLARRPGRRERLVLATKFFGSLTKGDPNGGGAGRKSILASVEQSLRRLQTDYLDIYWLHFWDKFTPIEETMRTLDDLVSGGKVRYIGFSDTPAWKIAQAQALAQFRGWAPLIAVQVEYSLLERTAEGEIIPAAQELGLGITPWSPLRNGALSGKYTRDNAGSTNADRGPFVTDLLTETGYTIVDELRATADELGTTSAAVALAWVQNRPGVTSTIIGARSIEQLDSNLAALDINIPAERLGKLDSLSTPTLNFPAALLQGAPSLAHAGAMVNGESTMVPPLLARKGG
jgi:aryl-alcohol dehydrogenase-like predicted oxidoreductase